MPNSADDFLAHFGIKGMKWGRRSEESKARIAREKESEATRVGGFKTDHARTVYNNATRPARIIPKEYKLSTANETIAKGTTLHRITNNPNYVSPANRAYTSYKPEDVERYKGLMSNFLADTYGKRSLKNIHDVQYTTLKKIVLPSEKQRVDTFVDLLDKPIVEMRVGFNKTKMLTGRDYVANMWNAPVTNKDLKAATSAELGRKAYDAFLLQQMRKTSLNTAYFDSLRRQGFSATRDDNDSYILSDSPIILLDTSAAKVSKVEKLNKKEVKNAIKRTPTLLKTN